MDELTTNIGTDLDVQTGVDQQPVAGDTDKNQVPETQTQSNIETTQTDKNSQQTIVQPDENVEKAFAARLKKAREQWESENARYLQTARELETYGYDLEALRKQARQQDVNELITQGWDPQAAQELVQAREQAALAQMEAENIRLEAEALRLAAKYGKDFDPEDVLAYARQRANETGESLTLETAFFLMTRDKERLAGEQAAIAALRAGQEKSTDSGSKGAGQKSIADLTDAEIEAINERVRRGEKVKF